MPRVDTKGDRPEDVPMIRSPKYSRTRDRIERHHAAVGEAEHQGERIEAPARAVKR